MMKKKLKEIFRIFRVYNWYYYIGFSLIGLSLKKTLSMSIIFKYTLLNVFLLSYSFSLNDFYDKKQKKKSFILPLIFAILMLPFFNTIQIILSLIFLIIVTAYSAYPLRLKAKPFISTLCNGFGFTILFLLGYFVTLSLNLDGVLFTLLFFSFNTVAQLIHEVTDLKRDRRDNIITTAVLIGKENIKKICYLSLFLTILLISYFFYLGIINILIFFSTVIFGIFSMIEIRKRGINIILRKRFKDLGILVGIIYIIVILNS
jgi:4-hydroxybenzoate polyprenyltransferase